MGAAGWGIPAAPVVVRLLMSKREHNSGAIPLVILFEIVEASLLPVSSLLFRTSGANLLLVSDALVLDPMLSFATG